MITRTLTLKLAAVVAAGLLFAGCASQETAFNTGPRYTSEALPTQVSGWNLGSSDMVGWQVFASREVKTAYLDTPTFDAAPSAFAAVETDNVD